MNNMLDVKGSVTSKDFRVEAQFHAEVHTLRHTYQERELPRSDMIDHNRNP